jgi:hypothetical protein
MGERLADFANPGAKVTRSAIEAAYQHILLGALKRAAERATVLGDVVT